MKTLLLDPVGGLAGDMLLGGLLDLGASPQLIRLHCSSLGLPRFELEVTPVTRRGVGCTKATWALTDETDHRHLPEILAMIRGSSLPAAAQDKACEAFVRLAEAEARVHRVEPEAVHFHEVGAADAILDITAACVALHELGVGRVLSNPLPAGTGVTRCAHGEMPAMAPATLELLEGFPIMAAIGVGEQVTPTGAALLATWGEPVSAGAALTPGGSGWGAGTREASLLRLTLVEAGAITRDAVVTFETHLDDATGEELGFLMERLFSAGAADVAYHPVTMKKGRPGVALTCMAPPGEADRVRAALFAHSTALGVREARVSRAVLPREVVAVETRFGPLPVKVAGGRAEPEFDPCAAAARAHGVPLRAVYAAARRAYDDRDA